MAKQEMKGIPENMTHEAELDLVGGFLKAVEFKTDEKNIKNIRIERNGEHLFTFRVHPLSEADLQKAKKAATTYMPNPAGKQFPPIEKATSKSAYNSNVIYLATVEEDKKQLWDNKALKDQLNVMQGYELIDKALLAGEKDRIIDVIEEISGYGEVEDGENKEIDDIEFAGN